MFVRSQNLWCFTPYCFSLFSIICFKCRKKTPIFEAFKTGTMVTMMQNCPVCGKGAFQWCSQPFVLGKYPAGNVLLSFGILMAGASVSKVMLVFKHMGLCSMTCRTFFPPSKAVPYFHQFSITWRSTKRG